MGWAKKRVQQYKKGKKASWLELRMLEHADPVNLILAIVGVIMLVYGLWVNSWLWILIGLGLNILGHIYAWMK
ncbi:MAG: hypothetical protein KJ623_00745 [Nanoarchaeota archaeon]|nr:hypothetical protein [Nanoarchaeota archaeon]MBU0963039.1 hypothetical protein [Nanoarchaeota archaeon]